MHTGPVLARQETPIGPNETASELAARLSTLGAQLLREKLPRFFAGELVAAPQDTVGMTLAPILEKRHGEIDWQKNSQQIHDLVRGMTPWPGAYTQLAGGTTLKVHGTHISCEASDVARSEGASPGLVLRADRASGLVVACGQGAIVLDVVQPEGKRRMTAPDFLAGRAVQAGDLLGQRASKESA